MRIRTHLFRSGVEVLLGCAGVVNAVLFAAGDADLHLQPDPDLGHALEVLCTSRDVLAILLLREVEHVAREEGLSVLLLVQIRMKHILTKNHFERLVFEKPFVP